MGLLEPDRYFSRISFIDPRADIIARGYTGVLVDVDNTVLPRYETIVPADVVQWFARVRSANIQVCLLSNNWHNTVHELSEALNVPLVAKALKPLPPAYFLAARKIDCSPSDVVVIGDQIGTDIVGAHLCGMGAYLVCPLVEKDLPHARILRNVERMFVQDQEPEGAKACETSRS